MPKRMTRAQLEATIEQIKAQHREGVAGGRNDGGERITAPVRLQFSTIIRIAQAMEDRMKAVYEAAVNEGLSDADVLKRLRRECGPHKSITPLNCMPHIDKDGAFSMSPQERSVTIARVRGLLPKSKDVPWWYFDDYEEFIRMRAESKRYSGRMRTRKYREKQKMLKSKQGGGKEQ